MIFFIKRNSQINSSIQRIVQISQTHKCKINDEQDNYIALGEYLWAD